MSLALLQENGGSGSSPIDWVNVTQSPYNAKGDGTTDDTTAIQAAIATGHTVYFPNPSVAYKCEGLYPVKTGQQFICENPRFSKFIPVTTGGHIWNLTLNVPIDPISGTGAYNYTFDGFRIQGSWNGTTGNTGSGWFADNGAPLGDNLIMRNCVCQGMGAGMTINGFGNSTFIQTQFQANAYGLICGTTDGNSFSMVGLQCTQNFTWNIWWKAGSGSTLILTDGNYGGATTAYNSAGGIRIGSSPDGVAANITILGANFEEQLHSSGIALQIEDGSHVTQFNAVFKNQSGSTAPPVKVLALSFYDMHNVSGGANNIPVQCVAGAVVTGDGAYVLFATDDSGGGIVSESGPWKMVLDNSIPNPTPANAGNFLKVIPRASQPTLAQRYLLGTTFASNVTISNASPAVVSWTNHGLSSGAGVVFSTTGALPTGLTAGTTYFVISAGLTASAFEVSATVGGSAINTSGAGSGTHSAIGSIYSDITNTTLLTANNTLLGNNTFSGTVTVNGLLTGSAGGIFTVNGGSDLPCPGQFQQLGAGTKIIRWLASGGGELGNIGTGGNFNITSGYLYVPRPGNASAGCLQTNEWTLYSPSTSPATFGVGFSGTQGMLLSLTRLHFKPEIFPSSDPHVAGDVWSNLGILTVSAG